MDDKELYDRIAIWNKDAYPSQGQCFICGVEASRMIEITDDNEICYTCFTNV